MAALPPLAVNSASTTSRSHGRAGLVERPSVAEQPVLPGTHVLRTCHRRDHPAAGREQVPGGDPRSVDIVGVDVVEAAAAAEGTTAQHGRDAELLQRLRQPVLAVQRHQQDPVDVPPGGVGEEPLLVLPARGHREHKLESRPGHRDLRASEHAEEERVAEHALLGLVDEERDRVAATGDQRPRRLVRRVGDLAGGRVHGFASRVADVAGAAQHPACGRPGHPGAGRHLLQRRDGARPLAGSRTRDWCGRQAHLAKCATQPGRTRFRAAPAAG